MCAVVAAAAGLGGALDRALAGAAATWPDVRPPARARAAGVVVGVHSLASKGARPPLSAEVTRFGGGAGPRPGQPVVGAGVGDLLAARTGAQQLPVDRGEELVRSVAQPAGQSLRLGQAPGLLFAALQIGGAKALLSGARLAVALRIGGQPAQLGH